jgi:hypothetical protein
MVVSKLVAENVAREDEVGDGLVRLLRSESDPTEIHLDLADVEMPGPERLRGQGTRTSELRGRLVPSFARAEDVDAQIDVASALLEERVRFRHRRQNGDRLLVQRLRVADVAVSLHRPGEVCQRDCTRDFIAKAGFRFAELHDVAQGVARHPVVSLPDQCLADVIQCVGLPIGSWVLVVLVGQLMIEASLGEVRALGLDVSAQSPVVTKNNRNFLQARQCGLDRLEGRFSGIDALKLECSRATRSDP